MKKLLVFFLFLPVSLFSADIPVVTLSHEMGTRFQLDASGVEEDDYQTADSMRFQRGTIQIAESFSKKMSLKYQMLYSFRNYDLSTNLNNTSYSHKVAFGWKVVDKVGLDLGLDLSDRIFPQAGLKNNRTYVPTLGIGFDPTKKIKMEFSYGFAARDYENVAGNYTGNRVGFSYEQRIVPEVNLKLRYKIENRRYEFASSQRQDSFNQSVAATLKIDLNKGK